MSGLAESHDMTNPLAGLEGVVVSYRGRPVLGPLSLFVAPGDFLGVVGPNAAGKSTLLEALAGLRPLAAGRRDPAPPRADVGILFQHHDYLPDLPFTAEDVVSFGRVSRLGLLRRPGTEDRAAVDRALARLGLDAVRHQPYRELSGGTRRRVHLARLLAQDATLVLLDEPTAGLDPAIQEDLIGTIAALPGPCRAVVMVTHDIDHLPTSCNRILLLKGGRPLAEGAPAAVLTEERLSALYDCRMGVEQREGRFVAIRLSSREGAA
jgi:ABC-type cobalamin/Fe3+-siderophores transport system ATPase subunit